MLRARNPLLATMTRREFGGLVAVVAVSSVVQPGVSGAADAPQQPSPYRAVGVGGGGAMTGLSMSPYSDIWFVATDMGTLFRSTDSGKSWSPIPHKQVTYPSELKLSASVGFLPDGHTMFHAYGSSGACEFMDNGKLRGLWPCRSRDAGLTWEPLSAFPAGAVIHYWITDDAHPDLVFAATSTGLLRSGNQGDQWEAVSGISGDPRGSFVDSAGAGHRIYHATGNGIYVSKDAGRTFEPYRMVRITGFAGGRDSQHVTLAYIGGEPDPGPCVCISTDGGDFEIARRIEADGTSVEQSGGNHIGMAANDSRTIYVTGNRDWPGPGAMGTKVWVSRDGRTFGPHVFLQRDGQDRPWPADRMEWSAVGLEIGWNDGGYHSFAVHPRASSIAGGTGNYFLHVTRDHGAYWTAPFTSHVGTGLPGKGHRWTSTGLEVVSIRYLKFHPNNPDIGYACGCDHHALLTEDGGKSWSLSRPPYNSLYDVAFDPQNDDAAFAAISNWHDWAHTKNPGQLYFKDGRGSGIYFRGKRDEPWEMVGDQSGAMSTASFIAVAYDSARRTLYAGAQGSGIFRRVADGPWERIVDGLGDGPYIVPLIEIDQEDGTVYALLTGNVGEKDEGGWNNIDRTGIHILRYGKNQWKILRGEIPQPDPHNPKNTLWSYPTSFAVDWKSDREKRTLYMVDADRNGQYNASGLWRSLDGGEHWEFLLPHTHAMHVLIDPVDRNRVYVTGGESVDCNWGWDCKGGLWTYENGQAWQNTQVPLQANGWSITPDPKDPAKVYYTFFGGGIMHGPRP